MRLTSANEWLEIKATETYLTRLQVAGSLKIYIYNCSVLSTDINYLFTRLSQINISGAILSNL